MKSLHDKLFKSSVEEFVSGKKYLCAAGLVERWLEFSNKLAVCGDALKTLVTECGESKGIFDLPWIEIDFEKEKVLIESLNKKAVDKLVQLIPALSDNQVSGIKGLPDYLGQAYTFGVEACHRACVDDDSERFSRLFPPVFFGSLAAFDRTRRETTAWAVESQMLYSTEPLEDLLTLSGYAKLYSELYQNQGIWKACEGMWNRYLGEETTRGMIGLIAAAAIYRENQFVLMPKAAIRANWERQFSVKLQELGLIRDVFSEHILGSPPEALHASPIIRVAGVHGDMMSIKARDLFFVTYLSNHPAAKDFDFPEDHGDLRQQIERESISSEEDPSPHE